MVSRSFRFAVPRFVRKLIFYPIVYRCNEAESLCVLDRERPARLSFSPPTGESSLRLTSASAFMPSRRSPLRDSSTALSLVKSEHFPRYRLIPKSTPKPPASLFRSYFLLPLPRQFGYLDYELVTANNLSYSACKSPRCLNPRKPAETELL